MFRLGRVSNVLIRHKAAKADPHKIQQRLKKRAAAAKLKKIGIYMAVRYLTGN